eukprot:CAMPEP_0198287616 /NCGR_PEP_ID=MMETSP1449-20131203/6364_1 /TAXON_ID=420275 /ORGANISM="Attheya septentrionalis, Strain CCMP2084" /LENGTH=443 /DNA_ID=CAMNT_0043985587 /DNA_START=82 /DNA_END=1413 /DNA_ORIENTATION=-
MGRKKGKQCGSFGSKAMRAAHLWEVEERVSEARTRSRNTKSERTPNEKRVKSTVNLNLLRGMLNERRIEDRMEDRQQRLQRTHVRVTGSCSSSPAASFLRRRQALNRELCVEPAPRHETGWMIQTEQRSTDDGRSQLVPSLQTLCIKTLGPVLHEYLNGFGKNVLHGILGSLPAPILASLSVACSATPTVPMTNDLATVLAQHNHVEQLCLRATPPASHNNMNYSSELNVEEDDDEYFEIAKNSTITDQGILTLIPRLGNRRRRPPDSWEDWEEYANDSVVEGCAVLVRLELVGLRCVSVHTLYTLFKNTASLTHLSLAGSHFPTFSEYEVKATDDEIPLCLEGPDELLYQLPIILTNLHVLDLSHCLWLTDTVLVTFIQHLRSAFGEEAEGPPNIYLVLHTIHVAGCTSLSQTVCDQLNEEHILSGGSVPWISTVHQTPATI